MIKKLSLVLAILAMLMCSACSDSFDPRKDAVIVDTQTVNDCYFVAFESKDEPGEMGVAVYRMTDVQQGLEDAQLVTCLMQEHMLVQGRDTYMDYIFVTDEKGNRQDYLVVLCRNPEVTVLHFGVNDEPMQMLEISKEPSVLAVALPAGCDKLRYEFYDAQGNAVRR